MKRKKIIALCSLLLLLSQSSAQTLKEVVRGTVISNPEIQALRLNTKAYRLYVDEEEGKLLPSIDLETFVEELNRDREGEENTRLSGTNTQLKLEQTLFNGWLTQSQIDEAKRDLKATQYKNFATIENVILDVIDAYLNVVKNEEIRLLSENNLLIHQDYLEIASQAEEVSGDTLDRMQVESKIFSANAKFSEVKRDSEQAKATLEKLYGQKLDGNICRPVIQTDAFDNLQSLIEDVLTVNYSVLEEIERIKTQRAIVTQEKSRFYPTITAKLLHEVDDGIDSKDTKKTENSIRITLSYNLFNGGQDKAILERERLFLNEAQKTLDDVVNGVIEEVKINYTKYHTAKKRIEYLKDYLEKNKDILIVYLEQFQGGTRSFLDILNHEAELFRAKTDLIQEQFTQTLAYYEILNLMSKLSSSMLTSDKQICEEIKVDIERRQLNSQKEDSQNDAELAAIFEEGNEAALEENNDGKDAKVQSMLNKILNEIYDPNLINKNISVSNITYSENSPDVPTDNQDENLTDLIKIKQDLEEKALREEQDDLKAQIKKEAENIAQNDITTEAVEQKDEEIEESESKNSEQKDSAKSKKKTEDVDVPKQDKVVESSEIKNEADAIREAAIQHAKEYQAQKEKAQKSEVQSEEEKQETKATVVENKTEEISKETENVSAVESKEVTLASNIPSLEEQQAQSRALAEEYKQAFRKKHGLDEFGRKIQKEEVISTKPIETKNEVVVEEIKTESKTEKVALNNEQEKALSIREKALKNVQKYNEQQKMLQVENKENEAVKEETEVTNKKVEEVTKTKVVQSNENVEQIIFDNPLKAELYGTNSTKYTIGILTLSTKREESFIKREYSLQDDIVVYQSQNKYYKVIYGLYDSAKEAKNAISTLPSSLRKNGVFVNRMSTHQKLFKKYNAIKFENIPVKVEEKTITETTVKDLEKKEEIENISPQEEVMTPAIQTDANNVMQEKSEPVIKEKEVAKVIEKEIEKTVVEEEKTAVKTETKLDALIEEKEQLKKKLELISKDEKKTSLPAQEKVEAPVAPVVKVEEKKESLLDRAFKIIEEIKEKKSSVNSVNIEDIKEKNSDLKQNEDEVLTPKNDVKDSVQIDNTKTTKLEEKVEVNDNKIEPITEQDEALNEVKNTPLIKNRLKEEFLGEISNKYTIGILTLSHPKKADFIKNEYNLTNDIVVYQSQNNGKIYFKVLYGLYDSVSEAKNGIKNLNPNLRKSGVFVNRISTHQKLFKKYNPNGEL